MNIPAGLRALLSQMGLAQTLTQKGGPAKGGQASAMTGQKGPRPGQVLGEDGLLLAGLGYAGADKHTDRKNVAERSNLTQFLQEQLRDGPRPGGQALVNEEGVPVDAGDAAVDTGDAQEGTERAPKEQETVRTQDRREEARVQGQKEATETAEAKETSESAEAEGQRQDREEQQDEEDKPGAGWVAEEGEEPSEENKRGLKTADALGQATRCHGTLEDGSRCLRKPTPGTPYCAEHAVIRRPGPALRG